MVKPKTGGNPSKTPGSRRYKTKQMKAFKKRCDDANADYDKRTGGAKVVKPEPTQPKWTQGPLVDDNKEGDYVLTFGKFKGEMLRDVDTSWLQWIIGEENVYPPLRKKFVRELVSRTGGVLKRVAGNGTTALGPHPETSPDRTDPPW